MFKNLMLFRLGATWPLTAAQLEEALGQEPFLECGTTQQKSTGWVPPRGHAHGALVESVGGQWIACLAVETKTVPRETLRKHVGEAAAEIAKQTGRVPGKKERRDLQEGALMALLPQAFPRRIHIAVWIDPLTRLLAIDASSWTKADEVVTALVRTAGEGFTVSALQTRHSPQACMAHWLADETSVPDDLLVERECELKSCGDEPARVRFDRHNLDTEEMRRHIAEGKLPTRLALNWAARVGFSLTNTLQLRKLTFPVPVGDTDPEADRFDADVALATSELSGLIRDLVEALGGENTPEPGLNWEE